LVIAIRCASKAFFRREHHLAVEAAYHVAAANGQVTVRTCGYSFVCGRRRTLRGREWSFLLSKLPTFFDELVRDPYEQNHIKRNAS
jgi:hypothetical protein